MAAHPTLVAAIADILAAADAPMSTSALSRAATRQMRRAVAAGTVANDAVMTWGDSCDDWEVTGATVAAICGRHPGITLTSTERRDGVGRVEKHWALTANLAGWAVRDAQAAAALDAVRARYRIDRSDDTVTVVDTSAGRAVATFDTATFGARADTLAERARHAAIAAIAATTR